MNGGKLYLKNLPAGKCSFLNAVFLVGILAISLPAFAQLNNPPSFTGGAVQSMSACRNVTSSINSFLAVSDPDAGQTETWTIASSPAHGTLTGFSTSATSTGGTITPAGLSYTPFTGYTGADTFTVQVSDGLATATTTIAVVVYAQPTLSSSLTPAAICDQTVFNYTPTSATPGATFTWHRNFMPGISNPAASGTGSVSETLSNTTYYDVNATYAYTVTAHGCSSTQNVVATIHPTPRLSSPLYDTICNGATLTYVPTSATAGTTFSWSRASVSGIAPATSSGTDTINESLTNSNATATTVVYAFTLTANGCSATRNLNVTVVPQAGLSGISNSSPTDVCTGTLYQNFSVDAPAAGATYSWSAINADIYAVSANTQNILANFPNPGIAYIILNLNGGGAQCRIRDTAVVNVSSGSFGTPASVIYYNYQLVYLDNTADNYHWGYDDAATLAPTFIPGAGFQSYPISSPDFTNRYYWVMVTKGGCSQKVYFNPPTAIANVNVVNTSVRVYPDPAKDVISVKLNNAASGTEVVLSDMLGRVLETKSYKGTDIQFDIAGIPSGCYLITCIQNGVKMAVTRFTRN